jgi:ferredoxin
MVEKKARPKRVPENECAFCGDCAAICSSGAITLKKPFRLTGFYKTLEDGGSSPPRL